MMASTSIGKGWQWLRQITVFQVLSQAASRWYADRPFELGAALAYYAVFSISPIVVLAVAVASRFYGRVAAEGRISEQLSYAVSPTVAHAIQDMLGQTYLIGSGKTATTISTIILLFGATGFFNQLQSSLNAIWRVRPKPGRGILGVIKDRLLSFLAVLGVFMLIVAGMLSNAIFSALAGLLPAANLPAGLHLWWGLAVFGSFVSLTLAFALIFQFLPDAKIAWGNVWIGAAVSSLLFILGNYLIGLYLERSGAGSAYGAAGSLIVILLWACYSAQSLLFGAQFTHVYSQRSGKPIEPTKNAERVIPENRA